MGMTMRTDADDAVEGDRPREVEVLVVDTDTQYLVDLLGVDRADLRGTAVWSLFPTREPGSFAEYWASLEPNETDVETADLDGERRTTIWPTASRRSSAGWTTSIPARTASRRCSRPRSPTTADRARSPGHPRRVTLPHRIRSLGSHRGRRQCPLRAVH